ncbi:MAG TPA: phospholipase D-like domain-containing protein [Mycobacterium sp.]|nr:phospholipase D-like domain-containing protein [Mycobacterium sp.]
MRHVTQAGAWCNGEVAYLAWDMAQPLPDCLGFMVTRVHETGEEAGARRVLPTWLAFSDQSNPQWIEQDSSVWPIQGFQWRDLTLRRSRNTTTVRPIDFAVHYEIVPVGPAGEGRTRVPASATAQYEGPDGTSNYQGPQHPLFMIGEPTITDTIQVTHDYGAASVAFTNGILSTQNLVRQLESVHKAPPAQLLADTRAADHAIRTKAVAARDDHLLSTLKAEIADPASRIRAFLDGDVFAFVTRLLDRSRTDGGTVYLALYELADAPLVDRLEQAVAAGRAHVILTSAGGLNPNPKNTPPDQRQPTVWDTENDAARARLHAADTHTPPHVVDRMFNNSARIGHNKFAVYVAADDTPAAVMTGSTNWTPTGLCTQSNNTVLIEDSALAGDYWQYWKDLRADQQPPREPLTVTVDGKPVAGAAGNSAKQGATLRNADATGLPERGLDGGGTAHLWRSPNTAKTTVPSQDPIRPPDLDEVYQLMDRAHDAIFFLTFMPGVSGKNNIIGEAADLAANTDKLILGAISDPAAMPPPTAGPGPTTYVDAKGVTHKLPPPAIWWPGGDKSQMAIVRATAIQVPFGNFRTELLSAGNAIIHDKIIVIDPCDAENCAVITGSHNLGYKASYCNDDNLVIVRGNQALAIAYAVHVLDLYDHYVFRARLEENLRDKLASGTTPSLADGQASGDPSGQLKLDSSWQNAHFAPDRPPSAWDYFLRHTPQPVA